MPHPVYDSPLYRRAEELHLGERIGPSFKVGLVTGTYGLLFGSLYGLFYSRIPRLYAYTSGLRFFLIGSTFWGIRSSFLSSGIAANEPSTRRTHASSAVSASISAAFWSSLFNGARHVPVATVQYAVIGYAGQRAYEWADGRRLERRRGRVVGAASASSESGGDVEGKVDQGEAAEGEGPKESFMEKLVSLRWTGLHQMSEGEYADMLEERVIKLEAEAAVVDEAIERLRKEGAEEEGTGEKGAAGGTEECNAMERGKWPGVGRR